TAKDVTANHRLYGIVEGMLLYAVDMAAVGQPMRPHLSARLSRVGG
ncbi:MAG TPA: heme-binding beta-barrel domain-containing protein, partial [Mycobacteriales bacterium]